MSTHKQPLSKPLSRWLAKETMITLDTLRLSALGRPTPTPCAPAWLGWFAFVVPSLARRLRTRSQEIITDCLPDDTGTDGAEQSTIKILTGIEQVIALIATHYHWTREQILALTPRQVRYHCNVIQRNQYHEAAQRAQLSGATMRTAEPALQSLYKAEHKSAELKPWMMDAFKSMLRKTNNGTKD